jgi:uncharacterized membrane protein
MSRVPAPSKALPLAVAALMTGCVPLDTAAPRVETLVARKAGARPAQLEQGRTIYITKCAKCHAPEPVHRYSRTRWEGIFKEMIEETKLDSSESAAVRAYVFAVLGN